jgi:hypothetical protein
VPAIHRDVLDEKAPVQKTPRQSLILVMTPIKAIHHHHVRQRYQRQ